MKLLLKNLLFTLLVPATVGVYLPLLLSRGRPIEGGLPLFVSLGLFAGAVGLYLWSVWAFAVHGRGTPAPIDAPVNLVTTGPFRYTRNPLYLSLFSALAGWLLLFPDLLLALYGLGAVVVVTLFVLGYEEPHLRGLFGREYDEYTARVPRWLPRLGRGARGGAADT